MVLVMPDGKGRERKGGPHSDWLAGWPAGDGRSDRVSDSRCSAEPRCLRLYPHRLNSYLLYLNITDQLPVYLYWGTRKY